MTILEAIQKRHSVRSYTAEKLSGDIVSQLQRVINDCNRESGLNIQMVIDEPKAFDSFMARYGKFRGVRNYIALIGQKSSALDEKRCTA